jgi:2-methylisocitrate lyase-like PEP mutase family enzyme
MNDLYSMFRRLHETGCFVLPNPWDAGGAKRLEAKGFQALASTSAGVAWSLGRADYEITLEECLAHLRMLCGATDLPVNADFEGGFADTPDGVAANVASALETGVAALSIEDRSGTGLHGIEAAAERIKAAKAAIEQKAPGALLVGRTEGFLIGQRDLPDSIARLRAYSEAGADVLYAPGVSDIGDIRQIVEAVAPKPVNVLISFTPASVAELAAAGVRRVSTGGSLAWAAWAAFDAAADTLLAEGRLPQITPTRSG